MFSSSLIAVDLGSSAVKVLELGGSGGRIRAIGCEILPLGAVVDGAVRSRDAVRDALNEMLKKLRIFTTGRRAAISIGGSSVIIKRVLVNAGSEDELLQQIDYEAEQGFQVNLSELYWDHYKLSNSPDSSGRLAIVLVGAKRELVEDHIDFIRSVGMRVGVIDAGVFSLANAFEHNFGVINTMVALINIGALSTQITLIKDGVYLYTRDLSLGSEEYTRQIMASLQVERDSAEALKVGAGQTNENLPEGLKKNINELNEQLVGELQSSIDFYMQSNDARPDAGGVSHIILSGGGSRTLGLDAALAAAMQIPVKILNPFQRIDLGRSQQQAEYVSAYGHLYGVAVGLALRKMNDREAV